MNPIEKKKMTTSPIVGAMQSIPNLGTPGTISAQTVTFCQANEFFNLAANKSVRTKQLESVFSGSKLERVFLSGNIRWLDCQIEGAVVEYLPEDFFKNFDSLSFQEIRERLSGALVIVNNNDAAQNLASYCEFYAQCPHTLFATWDWDNHHWLELSAPLAANCDVYFPGHHENLYLLSRFNWLIAGPVYCASVQWPARLLSESLPEMIRVSRSDEPLGMHIPYSAFQFRNQVISTLNQKFASIGFSDRTFHVRTPEDRLQEWIKYKIHWICPVLNDVPIRIFDALITGGIPIVPESMRYLRPVSEISDKSILFYSPQDILNPSDIVRRGVDLFNNGGAAGIAERHRYALNNHHGDSAISKIRNIVKDRFCASGSIGG